MTQRIDTEITTAPRFGFVSDDSGLRLVFPRAESRELVGATGGVSYGAKLAAIDNLEGRLDTLRWTADGATIDGAWLRSESTGGGIDVAVERVELPKGLRLVRADRGVEIVAPQVALSEMTLTVSGPFTRSAKSELLPAASAQSANGANDAESEAGAARRRELRQSRLRFLDSLSGRFGVTVKVVLDLPVIGNRTLDQKLAVPIAEGSLDYRALDEGLNWLEGAFIDLRHDRDKLALVWKVPIFGSSHELISWTLDHDAIALAAFGRVPVRSLADFRIGAGAKHDRKRRTLQALSLDAVDIALSLLAPRSVEVGGGMIMFGGDDQPGIVDLEVSGSIHDRGPGALVGAIGSVDLTIKDVHLGPAKLTADRLHFDRLDQLEVVFDGFTPARVVVKVHRVTATNLALQVGR